uniref:Uncharacterized protein n=1 Tax=Aegilops tauschii subsp. strangulata TaxID=200361 RepID=A0A453R5T6_AEGTS
MHAGVDDENAQGDVQLHQEPAQGSGRPQRPPLRPHVHHGQQQPRRRDHPQPPPLARYLLIIIIIIMDHLLLIVLS